MRTVAKHHTTHPSGFVAAAAEKCSPRFDDSGGEMYDVQSQGSLRRSSRTANAAVQWQRRWRGTAGELHRRASGSPMNLPVNQPLWASAMVFVLAATTAIVPEPSGKATATAGGGAWWLFRYYCSRQSRISLL